MSKQEKTLNRREAIKIGAAGALALAVWQAVPKSKSGSTPQEGEHRWAMVIDLDRCIGCNYCTLACQANNDIHPDIRWNRVLETQPVGDRRGYLPIPCQHCEHAACVEACPVQATYHRPDGIVMMDYDRCIGCRYCEVACPYGARSFNWEAFEGENPLVPHWGSPEIERRPRGVVEKCSFCYHRIDRGLAIGLTPGVDPEATPVCVSACPRRARLFGDLNDPDSPVSRALRRSPYFRLREELGTGPRVFYLLAEREEEETA